MLARVFLLAALLGACGCVTEQVPRRSTPPAALPTILDLPSGALPAGAYHGVQLHFEVDPADVPAAIEWIQSRQVRQLPPIVPEIEPGGRELYRVGEVHTVEYSNSMFQVGGYRYPATAGARLYCFKRRAGSFSFGFRGQGIVVPSDVPWSPSIYYYSEVESEGAEGARRRTKRVVREVLQVGLATIETEPNQGTWLVNGRRYIPDTSRPLELDGAVHARVAR